MTALYNGAGYVNMGAVLDLDSPFVFGWGARGIGKTYGALKELYERGKPFALMRNTQSELDMMLGGEVGNPFSTLNNDFGWEVVAERLPGNKYLGAFYNGVKDQGMLKAAGKPIGYVMSLSTVGRVRGADFSEIETIFFDEFIAESHLKTVKNAGDAFLNAYETINRNRELQGREPLKVVCMANANRVDNDIFYELGLVTKAYNMQRKKIEIEQDKQRGVTLINFTSSPIAQAKRETALYKLSGADSDFYNMAIENDFGYDASLVKSLNIKPFRFLANVGELDIYEHRDGAGYYIRPAKHVGAGFPSTERGLKSAKYRYGWLHGAWLDGSITFENVLCSVIFERYFG